MSSILSQLIRYVHDWTKPNSTTVGTATDTPNNKSCGDDKDEIYKCFTRITVDGSWKGEEQTLNCLRKIMNKVEDYPYMVVKGDIQSGKSSLMKYYSAYMVEKQSMNVIIILRNIDDDVKSMKIKLEKFRIEKKFKYDIVYVGSEDESELQYKMTCNNKIFLIEGNSTQLLKFNNNISADTHPLTMCIDELDLNMKDDGTKFQTEFASLLSSGKISQIIGITGTALPVFFKKDDLNQEQIISLESPLNYKGIHNMTVTDIDIYDNDIVEKTLVHMLDSDYAFYDKDGMKHPAIVLIKDEHIKTKQKEQMKKLHENQKLKENFCLIVQNGNGIDIQMCGYKKISLKKKKISINEALQAIKNLNDPDIRYIAIIAGNLASRGLSYVSDDYCWHLTHEILIVPKNSTGTSITQGCRLCGCYSDDIPLVMFTSLEIKNELRAYDALQERIVEKCEEELIQPEKLDEVMKNLTLDKRCVIGRSIDTKIKLKYNKISNFNGIMCGEKIDASTLKEAKEILKKETGKDAKVVIKKIDMKRFKDDGKMVFNENNYEIVRKILKKKGVNVQKLTNKRLNLLKNPDFITKTQRTADYFVADEKGFISVYNKVRCEEIEYGELILFETPNGFFSAKGTNGNKKDLEKMLSNSTSYRLIF
jgi:hypothetical protein